MVEVILGFLVGALLASEWGLEPQAGLWLCAGLAGALYLGSCAWWSRRRCWWCRGARWRGDGRGNLRDRNCLVCGGLGTVRRLGAVLMGR